MTINGQKLKQEVHILWPTCQYFVQKTFFLPTITTIEVHSLWRNTGCACNDITTKTPQSQPKIVTKNFSPEAKVTQSYDISHTRVYSRTLAN